MRTYLRKNNIVAVFTQVKVNGRTRRFLTYFYVVGQSFKKIDEKRISKENGNSAYTKLIEAGYVEVMRKEVA